MNSVLLLVVGAAAVGAIHSVLPDHWVPLAVVARAQNWSLPRLARVSVLAAAGHVVTSLAIGGVVALVGLQFQKQIETQQGHIVGGVLVITGVGFLIWGLTGRGRAHDPRSERLGPIRVRSEASTVQARADLVAAHSSRGTLVGQLAAIAVPFGAAASPDLTFLPLAIGATAFGVGAVGAVLGVFALVTMVTFVGLTVAATVAGYQMRSERLEQNANSITALVLIGIGALVYIGL